MSAGQAQAREAAERLLDGSQEPPPGVPQGVLALAWALKDACYASWNSEPARASRAAQLLARLATGEMSEAQRAEVSALADWTGGIASLTKGQMQQAVQAFDQAARRLQACGKPDAAAQTQIPKIMALSMLGQTDAAVACAERTHRDLLALGNVPGAARVSLNLGNLRMVQDAYADAAACFREAAVLFARLGEHAQSVLADIGLADALSEMGDFDEALRIYARARMRAEHRGLQLQQAQVDEAVAILDLVRGRYREALAGFESARRRFEALGVPQYMAIAERLLGDAYLELRLLPEALTHFETAVQRFRNLGLPVEEARALTQRGRALALLGRSEAGPCYAAAAALFEQQGNAVGQAAVALARAKLALASGDAQAALLHAAESSRSHLAAGQPAGHARAEVVRGEALLACGDAAQADAVFDATLATARALEQLPVLARSLAGKGMAALATGDRAAARGYLEEAIEWFEIQRRALPADEIRAAFLAGHLRPYEQRLRLALLEGEPHEVLRQLDRFRARALDDRMAESVATADDPEMQALRQRLNWLYRRVQRLQDEAGAVAATQDEVLRTERELLERTRRHRLAAPAMPAGAAADEDAALVPAELQAALQPGDALLEFGVQGDELFACIVRPEGVVVLRDVAPWSAVLDAARAARFQIETLRNGAAHVSRHLDKLASRAQLRLQALHRLLWAPLAGALAGSARVIVVPHGQLAMVPFAALHDGTGPLGAALDLSLAPSARAALRGLRRAPALAVRALALGESSRLPHAAREAQLVAGLFAQGRALVGPEATLAGLQRLAPEADVLHLACHAQFRSDNPRFSALHLVDGALTVDLAEGLALHGGTVVLSACETAMADDGPGDEMVGLVRAFLVAGASRVVASLWPVDDEVTYDFMAQFYAALATGAGPAAAVRIAQAHVRRDHPHPYFWGAFTVHGGW